MGSEGWWEVGSVGWKTPDLGLGLGFGSCLHETVSAVRWLGISPISETHGFRATRRSLAALPSKVERRYLQANVSLLVSEGKATHLKVALTADERKAVAARLVAWLARPTLAPHRRRTAALPHLD